LCIFELNFGIKLKLINSGTCDIYHNKFMPEVKTENLNHRISIDILYYHSRARKCERE
jgi:hypothetical protein